MDEKKSQFDKPLARLIQITVLLVFVVLVAFIGLTAAFVIGPVRIGAWFNKKEQTVIDNKLAENPKPKSEFWQAPDVTAISNDDNGKMILYGRDLIARTSSYLGPKGSVMQISNGMNCQNCHLDAGTKTFGNNYSAVSSTYPKFRARSGTEESIEKRVNDCFERSLNGQALADDSKEMRAIVSYINWLGKDVQRGLSPKGSGLIELPFLDRPASDAKGKIVYEQKCVVCHGKTGEGVALADGTGYQFPPLWGGNSYNSGAGLYRLSRFAQYVKANMPLGATHDQPQLTDEEAWDVAAYVNSLPRPTKDLSNDWPDISKKPVDHPFGPYKDGFDEKQHKYGPFKPIQEKRKLSSAAR